MIPPPLDAEPALQVVAPEMLRASFQRGIAAMQRNPGDEAASEGPRLVNMTAALGYEPARSLIAREYPKSQAIRSAVSPAEAVRFSLDPLFVGGRQSEANRAFLILLAAYFSGHQMIVAYAGDVLSALSDDRRLQTSDRLQILLVDLSHIPGACTALARAVVKARMVTGPECSPRLQLQIDHYLRVTPPAGDEAASRRQAMALLRGATDRPNHHRSDRHIMSKPSPHVRKSARLLGGGSRLEKQRATMTTFSAANVASSQLQFGGKEIADLSRDVTLRGYWPRG